MASTLNISLPEPLKTYVEAQTEFGDYGTPTQFIRELILNDRDRRLGHLEDELRAAMEEEPILITEAEVESGNFVSLFRKKLNASK
jgi:antitoxin ParD1/3/4